jgi:hypothetical protein
MKCVVFALILVSTTPTFAQNAPPQSSSTLVLEDGTPVRLRVGRTVSSEDAHVGDRVDFEVLEEVRVQDLLVIRKGSLALAAEPKKRMARGGKLGINIDDVKLISGEKVALRAVKDAKGGGHTGALWSAEWLRPVSCFSRRHHSSCSCTVTKLRFRKGRRQLHT